MKEKSINGLKKTYKLKIMNGELRENTSWQQNGKEITKSRKCPITNENYSVTVPLKSFMDWRGGRLAQDAFKDLDREQREFIISGTTPAMWEDMFGKEE